MYSYGQIIETLNKVARVSNGKDGGNESPLVSITVGGQSDASPGKKPDIVIANPTQEEIRAALLEEVRAKKKG
jgi:hypothetical protein